MIDSFPSFVPFAINLFTSDCFVNFILIRTFEFDPPDENEYPYEEASDEFPLTLAPRLVRDRFAVSRNSEVDLQPSSVVKTEYSTFTYFLTQLINGKTVTKTDIVVSSQVVTETQAPFATPRPPNFPQVIYMYS